MCVYLAFEICLSNALSRDGKHPDFVKIPSGKFLMGTSDEKPLPVNVSGNQPNRIYGSYNERPVIEHSVDSFEMSTTEITNVMYEQFDSEHQKLRGKVIFSHTTTKQ